MRYSSSHLVFCLLFSLIASDSSVFAEGIRLLGPNGDVQQILSDSGTPNSSSELNNSGSPSRYFGPTTRNQTLWSVASQVRPDNSVTVQQTLLALFQLNPQAFEDQNIHQLIPGSRLRIPSLNQISALSTQQAITVMAADKAKLTGQYPANLTQTNTASVAPSPPSSEATPVEKAPETRADVTPQAQPQAQTESPAPEISKPETPAPAEPAVNLATVEANSAKPVPVLAMTQTNDTGSTVLSTDQSQELQSLTEKNHQLRVMLANVQHELAALQGDVNDKERIEKEVARILSEQREQQIDSQRLTPTTFDQFASSPWLVAAAAFIPGALLSALLLLILGRRKNEAEQVTETETQEKVQEAPVAEPAAEEALLLMPDEEADLDEAENEENTGDAEFDDLSDGINFNLDDEEEQFSDLDDELSQIEASNNGIGVNGDEAALGLKDMERALDEAGDELVLEEESQDASLALDDDFDLTGLDDDEQSLELSQDDLDDLLSSAAQEASDVDAVEQALDGAVASDDDIDQLLSQFEVSDDDSSLDPFALDDDDESNDSELESELDALAGFNESNTDKDQPTNDSRADDLDELEALAGLSELDEDDALAAELADSSELLDDLLDDDALADDVSVDKERSDEASGNQDDDLDELEALAGLSDLDEDDALAAELADSSELLDDLLDDDALADDVSVDKERSDEASGNQDDDLDELEALAGLSDLDEDEALAAELADSSELLDDLLDDDALTDDVSVDKERSDEASESIDDELDDLDALAGLSDLDEEDETSAADESLDDLLADDLLNDNTLTDDARGEEINVDEQRGDEASESIDDELDALAGLSDLDEEDETSAADESLDDLLAEDLLNDNALTDDVSDDDVRVDDARGEEINVDQQRGDEASESIDDELDDLDALAGHSDLDEEGETSAADESLDDLLAEDLLNDNALTDDTSDDDVRVDDARGEEINVDQQRGDEASESSDDELDELDALAGLSDEVNDVDRDELTDSRTDDLELVDEALDAPVPESVSPEATMTEPDSPEPDAVPDDSKEETDGFEDERELAQQALDDESIDSADELADEESLLSSLLSEPDEESDTRKSAEENTALDEQNIQSLLDDPNSDSDPELDGDHDSPQASEPEEAQSEVEPAKPFNRNEFIDDLQQVAPQKDALLDEDFNVPDEESNDALATSSQRDASLDLPENEFGKPSDDDWQFDDVDLDSLLASEPQEARAGDTEQERTDSQDDPVVDQVDSNEEKGSVAEHSESDTSSSDPQASLDEEEQPVGYTDEEVLSDDDLFSAKDSFDELDEPDFDAKAIADNLVNEGEEPVGFSDDEVLSDDALFSAIEDAELDFEPDARQATTSTAVDSEEQDALFDMFESDQAYTSKDVEQFDEKAMANLLSEDAEPAEFDLKALDDGGSSAGMDFDAMLEMGEDWSGFNNSESEPPLDDDEQAIWADSEALKQPEIQQEDWHKQDSVSSSPKQKYMTIDELMAQVEAEEAEDATTVDDELQLNVGLSDFPDVIGELDEEDVDLNAEAAGKLDLAKIYIEMNDDQGAKKLLEEAIVDGNDGIRREAKSLIDYLNDRSYE
ncbi:FimV/HubP family polar landmark protein [Vibrio sp. HB161653]|uniref:FimV/HubP family polar landmark protein n=1 Tax=Vibrio sp. HB161653 TaxID=3068274 RepID=UPI00273D47CA|nr:FimV/HubP family polar landmark protein [Vibrio sp. HB161653]MDP5254746.1 FimV/HubP family polar landmark protein [Vibrio sp. HB161653]